jgi:hypothetical protein
LDVFDHAKGAVVAGFVLGDCLLQILKAGAVDLGRYPGTGLLRANALDDLAERQPISTQGPLVVDHASDIELDENVVRIAPAIILDEREEFLRVFAREKVLLCEQVGVEHVIPFRNAKRAAR